MRNMRFRVQRFPHALLLAALAVGLAPAAAAAEDLRDSPLVNRVFDAVRAREKSIDALSVGYKRIVGIADKPGADANALLNSPAALRFSGRFVGDGQKWRADETQEGQARPSEYAFDGRTYQMRAATDEKYIAVSRTPGKIKNPSGGDPWSAQEGQTARLMEPGFFTQITAVEQLTVDGDPAVKIVATKEVKASGPDGKPLDLKLEHAFIYSLRTDLLLKSTVASNGIVLGEYRLLKSDAFKIDGNSIYVPLMSQSTNRALDGSVQTVTAYEIDPSSVKINQKTDEGQFKLAAKAGGEVWDLDLNMSLKDAGLPSDLGDAVGGHGGATTVPTVPDVGPATTRGASATAQPAASGGASARGKATEAGSGDGGGGRIGVLLWGGLLVGAVALIYFWYAVRRRGVRSL